EGTDARPPEREDPRHGLLHDGAGTCTEASRRKAAAGLEDVGLWSLDLSGCLAHGQDRECEEKRGEGFHGPPPVAGIAARTPDAPPRNSSSFGQRRTAKLARVANRLLGSTAPCPPVPAMSLAIL